jgi:hypothetical protein
MHTFTELSNQELLEEVKRLAACERQATVQLVASLMEVDARRRCDAGRTMPTRRSWISVRANRHRVRRAIPDMCGLGRTLLE